MKTGFRFLMFAALVVVIVGVGWNYLGNVSIAGDSLTVSKVFMRDIAIAGNHNKITIQQGSQVKAIYLKGSGNVITIEDGAQVNQIMGLGSNNLILASSELLIDMSKLSGDNNKKRSPSQPTLDGL